MKIKIVLLLLLAILGYTLADDYPEDPKPVGRCDFSCSSDYVPVRGMDSKGNTENFHNIAVKYTRTMSATAQIITQIHVRNEKLVIANIWICNIKILVGLRNEISRWNSIRNKHISIKNSLLIEYY
ncbi:uncharacterized protein LOC124371985 [Homalodisca vitripennis]|uniref:uncharacterized protein LOC124371985 n=1 Tax=Homalodisca vitripennis TaxID=197043 RepID=UPI001EEB6B49|nr:uncharacterized protein LOC124371985 [Homalodisca vitripennis]